MTDITLQLFSARKTALSDALKLIAAAGYKSVEAYGENFQDEAAFKSALQANGLSLVSAHVSLGELENNLDEAMTRLKSFGATHMVCPFLLPEDRPTDTGGWVALAGRLVAINEKLASNGFTFAWHNHDFEFEALADGGMPMQILLDTASDMQFEADIGWIVRANADPKLWLQKYANRISAIHLKDIAPDGECADEDGWADVGQGEIDWPSLVTDIKNTSAKHFIVEHDNPADLKRFVERSFASISAWGL